MLKKIHIVILRCIVLSSAMITPCLAQPTGQQRLFLDISDKGHHIPFEKSVDKNGKRQIQLVSHKYQLNDISNNPTGFELYPERNIIHKTLMNDDHRIMQAKK